MCWPFDKRHAAAFAALLRTWIEGLIEGWWFAYVCIGLVGLVSFLNFMLFGLILLSLKDLRSPLTAALEKGQEQAGDVGFFGFWDLKDPVSRPETTAWQALELEKLGFSQEHLQLVGTQLSWEEDELFDAKASYFKAAALQPLHSNTAPTRSHEIHTPDFSQDGHRSWNTILTFNRWRKFFSHTVRTVRIQENWAPRYEMQINWRRCWELWYVYRPQDLTELISQTAEKKHVFLPEIQIDTFWYLLDKFRVFSDPFFPFSLSLWNRLKQEMAPRLAFHFAPDSGSGGLGI